MKDIIMLVVFCLCLLAVVLGAGYVLVEATWISIILIRHGIQYIIDRKGD
jgi:hypothetical protein